MKAIIVKALMMLALLAGPSFVLLGQKEDGGKQPGDGNPRDSPHNASLQDQSRQIQEEFRRKKEKIDSLRTFVKGFPVAPFKDTLFYVYARSGSFTPKDRAQAIGDKIRKISGEYFFNGDSLKVEEADQSTDVIYQEIVITSLTDYDALWMNSSRDSLGRIYRDRIAAAIHARRAATSWLTLVREIGLAALVIVVLAAIIFLVGRLFRVTRYRIRQQQDKQVRGIRIRNYLLFDARQEIRFLLLVNQIIKWVVILVVIYLTLPILFGIFPGTREFATTLLNFILGPLKRIAEAVWNYIPNLITILVIIVLFRYFLKAVYFFKGEIERGALRMPGFYPDWANPTFQIIRVLALAFMLVVIFPYLPGSNSPIFKGVSVFLGVLFTFGSAGSLGNVIAGLVLTYMRAFRIGDRVRIGETTGDIIEKSLLVTRIRTIKNEIISIPNSTVLGSHTINFSSDAQEKGLILHTSVTIGYDAPWRQIHELLVNAALATEGIEKEPRPFVLQTALDDFYVSYEINAYTKQPNHQSDIYSWLHQQIQDHFFEAGVEIMSPHYGAMRDGNATAMPPDYLPKGYTPTGFRFEKPAEKKDTE